MASPDRIAIVGAGITGASTAHYLDEALPEATIEVFERADRVGGRLRTLTVGDRTIEAGGKFLHTDDRRCAGFVEAFDLGRADPADLDDSEPPEMGTDKTLGIWDGDSFRINLESSLVGAAAHLLTGYPLSVYRLLRASSTVEDALDSLDDALAEGRAFESPAAMCEAVGLTEHCRTSAAEFLADAGVSDDCLAELVGATAQTTFGQGPSVHAFGALYAVLSMGAGDGDPFAVEGGNVRLVEALLDASDATVHTDTAVETVARTRGGYAVETSDGTTPVSDVVIATPLETADIELDGIADPTMRDFYTNQLSFVVGDLDPDYFGTDAIPDFVTAADDPDVPFTLFSRYGPVEGFEGTLYELDTPGDPDAVLDAMFERHEVVESIPWSASPVYDPDADWPAFELAEGCYYPNAIESLLSTIEFGALAGENVATLIAGADAAERPATPADD
ncbi:MAG: FAD-dependent oxidoreductase [Halococcoides sp.]